jgi:threonylcarbamoyladenosine tRNA methylthiotransferase MtaB
LSSIDSIEADRHLLDLIADEPRFMPHLHLSLQHGDDMILKRMKRRHSAPMRSPFIKDVRRLRPKISFGADMIAGFPTETEEMFGNACGWPKRPASRICTSFPTARAGHAGRPHAAARPGTRQGTGGPAARHWT